MQYIRGVILNEFFFMLPFFISFIPYVHGFFYSNTGDAFMCFFCDHINCLFSYFGISICILNFMVQRMLLSFCFYFPKNSRLIFAKSVQPLCHLFAMRCEYLKFVFVCSYISASASLTRTRFQSINNYSDL